MGEQKVSLLKDKKQMHRFVKHLLADVRALEYMIENDWFEKDITRIGAEQEMCMVQKDTFKPAPIATEVLKKMKSYKFVETELARFNLETNQTPLKLTGKCFSKMENEIFSNLKKIKAKLKNFDADIILCGILPTLRKFDLEMHNLTPKKRYKALMEAINSQLTGSHYELRLRGIDELLIKHDSPLLEACNTSFQVHLQIHPNEFVKMYNISQALAGPVMAIAANSPIVFGKRLWHESRIALFQQSLDTRASSHHLRERSPRVNFGKEWLQESILEIYKEDIARFRVLIAGDVEENSLDLINKNEVPKLRALQVHNSTVYRWNRPCYGISENGQPHLRIENRVLPSGPTVADEMANAAFWIGCMIGMADEVDDITKHISFEDASDNFGKAAQFGIDTKFTWFNDKKITAVDIVKKHLLPIAKKGLVKMKVAKKDIDRYLGIIKGRADKHMNGARWTLRAYTRLKKETTPDEALTILTASIIEQQSENKPVHLWKLPTPKDLKNYRPANLKVEEFMSTDLFTVQKDDIIELVADLMEWKKLRFTPVENRHGELIGLISSQRLISYFKKHTKNGKAQQTVEDIMIKKPPTIGPQSTIVQAMNKMKKENVACLPVVQGKELIGLITEMDFLKISNRLIERL